MTKKTLAMVQALYDEILETSNGCDIRREDQRIKTKKALEKIRLEKTIKDSASKYEEVAQSFYILVCSYLDDRIDILDYQDSDLPL